MPNFKFKLSYFINYTFGYILMICQITIRNNKNKIIMESDSDTKSVNHHRRRLSLFDRAQQFSDAEHRQQIRQKYQCFLQSRKRSLQESPHSPQTQNMSKSQALNNDNMPSIRCVREHNQHLQQSLRRTLNRYHYFQNEKERQLQLLERKKSKFDKIIKIREQHRNQKKKLSESLKSLHDEISKQKYNLKHSVDFSKMLADKSRIKTETIKKMLGSQRRSQVLQNKSAIEHNKSIQLQNCRHLHSSILSQKMQLKRKKEIMLDIARKKGNQAYSNKLKMQLSQFNKIDKQQQTTRAKFMRKIEQIQKSKQLINSRLKQYESVLKDGSTLRKPKIHLKIKNVQNEEQSISKINSKRHKTAAMYSDSQDSIF